MDQDKIIKYLDYLGFVLISLNAITMIFENIHFKSHHELYLFDENQQSKFYSEQDLKNWALKKLDWEEKRLIIELNSL